MEIRRKVSGLDRARRGGLFVEMSVDVLEICAVMMEAGCIPFGEASLAPPKQDAAVGWSVLPHLRGCGTRKGPTPRTSALSQLHPHAHNVDKTHSSTIHPILVPRYSVQRTNL